MIRSWCIVAALGGCGFELAPAAGGGGDVTPGDGRPGDGSPDGPPTDLDGDTIVNAADNCPTVANLDQRDHDADNRGDACDVCPHLPSAIHADNDGDKIGDDCDPRPSQAGDSVALWDGFYADSTALAWTKVGQWTLDTGSLRQVATGTTHITLPMDVPRTFLQAGGVVDQISGGFSTLGVFAGDTVDNLQSYGCLASRSGSTQTIAASAKWAGMPGAYSAVGWAGALDATRSFRFDLKLTTQADCTVRQGGEVALDSESVGPIVGKPGFYLDDVAARFDYVFVVAIGT